MKVSVVIPAYNGAHLLGRAMESVLGQTHSNLELVVVDDASPDETASVVRSFPDPRVRYIRHARNQGATEAWSTGLKATTGDLIACLDQDDYFHPDKLRAHVHAHEADPGIGLTYNARYELRPDSERIREIWWPPVCATVMDVVNGFPFAPSDMVMRRHWTMLDGLWDSSFAPASDEVIVNGSEILYCGLLHLAGCRFARIDRALNYRRRYARRVLRDIASRCISELRCQERILADPRCPAAVRAEAGVAFATTYMSWAVVAFHQGESTLAVEFLRKAAQHNPALLRGQPAPAVTQLTWAAVSDDTVDHEGIIDRMFDHLPAEMEGLRPQQEWAKAAGHLIHGVRELMWSSDDSRVAEMFQRAARAGAEADEWLLGTITHQLLIYEAERGAEAAERAQRMLSAHLALLKGAVRLRQWKATWAINRAFHQFHARNTAVVPTHVWRAVTLDPRYLANRGVLSMLARVWMGIPPGTGHASMGGA